ncbi:peptidase M28 [Corallococcus sp. H22C18031201]|uniref:M28 family metallopeptidase n=1 Tax=Citreicoccus inhibens TaxID=2849499 RepID=UPI000E719DAE|nr:M28 family peptidase [Citreicoccus inhibens]MBU8895359.1 M28 family peptidase [Citreicoccus inhibens]RJS22598.1 peptidase M28 [Corallococcus sp. H22C18031201]
MATKIQDSSRPRLNVSRPAAQESQGAEAKPQSRPLAFKDGFESASQPPRLPAPPPILSLPAPPPILSLPAPSTPTTPQVPPEGGPSKPPASADSDPMKYIEYLSSDAMKGRDSPSAGLDAASAYVQEHVKKYGLVGPNSKNPENPFQQKFNVYSFLGTPAAKGELHAPHKDFGHKTFEEGFYLDDQMPKDTLAALNRQYESTMKATGQSAVAPRSGKQRSVEELRQVATATGQAVNTMAMLPGTGPHKDEVIVVMAHLDHVGTDRKGNVYNGADDNASGSAVLMASVPELAEMQKNGKLDRSVLFIWTGAEEKGLVGSQYFVDHPIPGLEMKNIAGVINTDMVGRWDDQRLSVVDTNTKGQPNYFHDMVDQANQKLADPFDRINRDINVYRDRQDGASFGRKGEDVLFLFEGLSNPKGGGDLIPEYHEPEDDIGKIIEDNGGQKPRRIKDLLVNVIGMASNRVAEQ